MNDFKLDIKLDKTPVSIYHIVIRAPHKANNLCKKEY